MFLLDQLDRCGLKKKASRDCAGLGAWLAPWLSPPAGCDNKMRLPCRPGGMVVPTVWVLAALGGIKLETGETHRSP